MARKAVHRAIPVAKWAIHRTGDVVSSLTPSVVLIMCIVVRMKARVTVRHARRRWLAGQPCSPVIRLACFLKGCFSVFVSYDDSLKTGITFQQLARIQVKCPDGAACDEKSTCCQMKSGQWGCCKFSQVRLDMVQPSKYLNFRSLRQWRLLLRRLLLSQRPRMQSVERSMRAAWRPCEDCKRFLCPECWTQYILFFFAGPQVGQTVSGRFEEPCYLS